METAQAVTPKYFHLDAGVNGGKVTAAIDIKTEAVSRSRGAEVAYIGLAWCSPVDQFSRKRGRLISAGRLRKNKHFFRLVLDPTKKLGEQVIKALDDSITEGNEKLPHWLLGV